MSVLPGATVVKAARKSLAHEFVSIPAKSLRIGDRIVTAYTRNGRQALRFATVRIIEPTRKGTRFLVNGPQNPVKRPPNGIVGYVYDWAGMADVVTDEPTALKSVE